MEKVKAKVSIVIPVYNAQHTLQISLKSLMEQTYSCLELIFVDDGSQDESYRILESKRSAASAKGIEFNVIRHKRNKGVACARNTGLDHATGQYIYYVDADDFLENDAIEQLVETAEKTGADIVGCHWFLEFANNRRVMRQPICGTGMDVVEAFFYGKMRWNLWAFLVRRSLYENQNFRFLPGMNMGEDLMMMVKLLTHAKKFTAVNRALYHYSQTNMQSLTKNYSQKHMDEVSINIREIEHFLGHNKFARPDISSKLTYLKLHIKLPMLISSEEEQYVRWIHWFPEVNAHAARNPVQPLRIRLLQRSALHRYFWLCKLYYYLVVRFMYGIIYR